MVHYATDSPHVSHQTNFTGEYLQKNTCKIIDFYYFPIFIQEKTFVGSKTTNDKVVLSGLRFSFFIIYFMFLTDIWPVISCVLLLLLLLLLSQLFVTTIFEVLDGGMRNKSQILSTVDGRLQLAIQGGWNCSDQSWR